MQIAVIMSTYNGECYLEEQIKSILEQNIADQEDVNLELFVRDDGSSDKTMEILNHYAGDKIHVYAGCNKGYGRSFVDCLHEAVGFDYYAFSDQDDFWEKEKLKKAVDMLEAQKDSANLPAIYYSNVKVSDENLNVMHTTELQCRKQTLESVSMRRSIAGCTMVFNGKLWKEIFRNTVTDNLLAQGHDSFIISLCYALGGVVYCDKNAYIRYWQHTGNTVGAPSNIKKRIKKEWKTLYYDTQAEIKIAKAILDGWYDEISIESRDALELLTSMGGNWNTKTKIFLSSKYTTGDARLTAVEKLKVLMPNAWRGKLRKIDDCSVVSFDVFDTLISRDCCGTEDIYRLMERKLAQEKSPLAVDFVKKRLWAENLANEKYHGCATTHQIYLMLLNNMEELAEKDADRLVHIEEEIEYAFCVPKYEGRVLFEYSLFKRKRIVLISDMHLSKKAILCMLRKCGYRNIDEDMVYISSAMGMTKRSGKLFEAISSSVGLEKQDWVHIGDAKRSDWLIPRQCGMDSVYIPSEIDHFRYKGLKAKNFAIKGLGKKFSQEKSDKYAQSGTVGNAVCDKLMNNRLPWIRDPYERFGYECLGSLLLGFTEWLHSKLKVQKYDRIYFLAREGQLLKEAFDYMYPKTQSFYLPVSRKALIGASLWMTQGIDQKLSLITFPEEFGIAQIEDKLSVTIDSEIKALYSKKKFHSWEEVRQCSELHQWLERHEIQIDAGSKKQYDLFIKLLALNHSIKRIAIIDIGWKGTMQHSLESILSKDHGEIVVNGFYVGVAKRAAKAYPNQKMEGYLFREIDENKIFAFSGLLEGIMTADHGSVKNYYADDNEKVCYGSYPYEYAEDNRVSCIQDGAIKLLKDIRGFMLACNSMKHDCTYIPVSEQWAGGRMARFGYHPHEDDIALFRNFTFFDGDTNVMNTSEKRKTLDTIKAEFRVSKWKTAYLKKNLHGLPFTSEMYAAARWLKNR